MLTRPTDHVAILGVIDPDVYTAAAYSTGWIPVAEWH
jgi:hypothetical protein